MMSRTSFFLVGALVLSAAACYSPNITSGGFQCATGPGVKACPDGFTCSGGLCVKAGTVVTGSGGATGSGGTTGSGGAIGSGGTMGTGGSGMLAEKYKSCTIINAGQATQKDNCAAGLKCVDDCGTGQHCYPVCATDAECPDSACTRVFAGLTGKFCEQPFTACDPLAPSGTPNGCTASLTCHLLSSQPAPAGGDRSACECQTGAQGPNESCGDTRNCFGGLVCPPMGMLGGEYCRYVCDPMKGTAACSSGTCRQYGARWGYCF